MATRPESSRGTANAGVSPAWPERVLVLGDLHMGAGSPAGAIDPLECFFHDRPLASFLDRVGTRWARLGRRGALVLNGDAFDFVRVVRLPADAAEVQGWEQLLRVARVPAPARVLAAAVAGRFPGRQRRYGPDATEYESVWKLWLMARGHGEVFAALSRWCRAGHEVVVVRGNHDVEWAWPGVRRAFRALLEQHGSGPLPAGSLHFRMHRYRRGNLHVEHGHAIRWTTWVEGLLTPGHRPRLHQPFGSLLNRYVLNPVERFAQRPPGVPSSRHLKQLLREDPLTLWGRLIGNGLRGVPSFGRATWGMWHRRAHTLWPTRVAFGIATALLLAPDLSPRLTALLSLDATSTRTAAALLALATPHLGLAVLEIIDTVRDDSARRARALALRLGSRLHADGAQQENIVVLGHAHVIDVHTTGEGGRRVAYLNPGSWMGEDSATGGRPHVVWTARRGAAFTRARVLALAPDGRLRGGPRA